MSKPTMIKKVDFYNKSKLSFKNL